MCLYYDKILQWIGSRDEHNTSTGVSGEFNNNPSAEAQWRHLHRDAEYYTGCCANWRTLPDIGYWNFKIKSGVLLWYRTLPGWKQKLHHYIEKKNGAGVFDSTVA